MPSHQCMLYEGSPAKHLPGLAAVLKQQLLANWRCLYLNSPQMVAEMGSCLGDAGIAVADEVERGALILSSSQDHLLDGQFEIDRMLDGLSVAVDQALCDGYTGLWATGDIRWEFGGETNFAKLLEYEYALERLMQRQPSLCGICQYHIDSLPTDVVQWGLCTHPFLYINEERSQGNPHYCPARLLTYRRPFVSAVELQEMIARPSETRAVACPSAGA